MTVILYVAPHQDDETLSMGPSIRRHLEAGHDVHVLLLTAGSGSAAQASTTLNDEAFSRTRDDEFVRACRALGVRFENIHFAANRIVGLTTLSVADAQAAIAEFAVAHPGVWVKTYTNLPATGRHVDHVAAGQAAVNLLADGTLGTNTVRLYVEPWAVAAFQAAHPTVALSTDTTAAPVRVTAACDEYQDVDHPGGKYGIGYLSVGPHFTNLRANPISRYHVP